MGKFDNVQGQMTRKVSTGITGFDRMSGGGLPAGRVTAAIGGAGTGKTVFALQTLVHRINESGRPGILVTFEQSADGITSDINSFAWEGGRLLESGKLIVIDGRPKPETVMSGSFDIAGLLAMTEGAAAPDWPSCIVFDGIDTLLALLGTATAQRAELLRLQDFINRIDSMVILTIKAGSDSTTGFEEIALYMADCVIELSRETEDGASPRGIRIQKYRSSDHMLRRLPFLMTAGGIEVEGIEAEPRILPVSSERLSLGVPHLDVMLAGGIFRGSSTLLSGSPGTAKTTLGCLFVDTMCKRGERALSICFDEGPMEIVRNVASVGIDLQRHINAGLLRMHSIADRSAGPDEFAFEIRTEVERHRPSHLVIDPISVFTADPISQRAVRRIIELCKRENITIVLTSLLDRAAGESESSRSYVSTICDTWIHLSYVLSNGERNRALTIVKSRGTAHSNQVGELLLAAGGVSIADAYTEDGEVLMGSLRWQKERSNQRAIREAEAEAKLRYHEAKRGVEELAQRIAMLTAELAEKEGDVQRLADEAAASILFETERRGEMSRLRSAMTTAAGERIAE
ncbi:circadian clock protein KaiC [Kaistia soli DSM 19436]|uniref:non-specific serine/threonine protein kinase n=1 Tax=Kaistia soli DSM 19436 TaxID=1122133 RepID=A0A1M5L2Z9_9HYPH|nr:circadian clock protein KaiC [Kaistia soli]SHG59482.1 circadian clock protein KaiC [Kaistia soli DSM 19436]